MFRFLPPTFYSLILTLKQHLFVGSVLRARNSFFIYCGGKKAFTFYSAVQRVLYSGFKSEKTKKALVVKLLGGKR